MKKIIAALALTLISSVSYAQSYTCTAYTDSKQVGEPMKVNASKTAVAEAKAGSRLKKEGKKVDYVNCK